ncbi:MAG: helix-turn-helix domain-containing protein [Pirellulaceae bacterium]
MAETPGEVMSLDELAVYLKVSKSTLYKLVQQGGFPGQKVGKQWRFHKSAVDDWLRANPQSPRGGDTEQDDGA